MNAGTIALAFILLICAASVIVCAQRAKVLDRQERELERERAVVAR